MASNSVAAVEHGFVCENCKRGRKFGAGKVSAGQAATRHWMRYKDHTVHITETRIVETLDRTGSAYHQLGDEPPF